MDTWYHEYTTMHAMGLTLVFWLMILRRLQRNPLLVAALLLFGLALFLRSSLRVEEKFSAYFEEVAVYTEEYDRILKQIGRSGQVVHSNNRLQDYIMNDAPYVLGFYLGDNVLSQRPDGADYIVSSRGEYRAQPPSLPADDREGLQLYFTRTPDNQVGFLFDRESAEVRFLPEDLAPRHNFGGELTLGHWSLRDSVQVQPCQRIHFESWWQATVKLQTDYSLQLVMAAADGRFVASTDFALTSESTRFREPGDAWYLDARRLQIPCDTPVGEYSLLLIVFDPRSLELSDKLPLIQADGSAGDTWLYLTTLFVS